MDVAILLKIHLVEYVFSSKTKYLNLMKRINESKTRVKYISCECRCKVDSRKFNLKQKLSVNVNVENR